MKKIYFFILLSIIALLLITNSQYFLTDNSDLSNSVKVFKSSFNKTIKPFIADEKNNFATKIKKSTPSFHLVSSDSKSSFARFSLPKNSFAVTTVSIFDRKYTEVNCTKAIETNQHNRPMLPYFVQYFLVPSDATLELVPHNITQRRIAIDHPPKLATGDFPRKGFIPEVNYTWYDEGEVWPKSAITLGESSTFRGNKIVPVIVYPFSYDPLSKELIIRESYSFSLKTNGGNLLLNSIDSYREFSQMLKSNVINYQSAVEEFTHQTRQNLPQETFGHILLVLPPEFSSAVEDFINWKRKIGFTVSTFIVEKNMSNNVNAIKGYITEKIKQGVTHIIICGDKSKVPSRFYFGNGSRFTISDNYNSENCDKITRNADNNTYSDLCYVGINPASNKVLADAFISRFPTNNAEDLFKQLERVIKYEKGTLFSENSSQDWLNSITMVGSHEGTWSSYNQKSDYEHLDLQVKKLKNAPSSEINNFVEIYDRYKGNNNHIPLISSFSNGTNFTYYLGHGSKHSWSVTGFRTELIKDIKNSRPGISIQPVCLTGAFWDSCMSQIQLTSGKFIGVYASTSNTYWNPPMILIDYFTNILIENKYDTIGAYLCAAMQKTLMHSINSNYIRQITALQLHYFGDCSMGLRTRRVKDTEYHLNPVLTRNENLNITLSGENPQARTTISIEGSSDNSIYSSSNNNNISLLPPAQEGFYKINIWNRNASFTENSIQIGSPILLNSLDNGIVNLSILLNAKDFFINDPNFEIIDNVVFVKNQSAIKFPFTLKVEYTNSKNERQIASIVFDRDRLNNDNYRITLQKGWNLLGSPVNTVDTTDFIFKENTPLFFFNEKDNDYKECYNSILQAEKGFWIFSENEFSSSYFTGTLPDSTLNNLERGWNLFSPSKHTITPEGVLVWSWDQEQECYIETQNGQFLEPLKGYWIFNTN